LYNLKDILYESLKSYRHMRPYMQSELDQEVDEYLDNEHTKRKLPKFWKDKDDGYSDIKTALYEFPSEEEIRSLENSDAGEILDLAPEDRMKEAISRAKKYGKDYKRIIQGLKTQEKIPAPIVVRDKSKRLYLLGGNSRLMLGIALGLNLPIKIIDWKKEIQENILEVSSGHISTADEGEPDTGFSPAGQTRVLGVDDSKPEPWYNKGGYSQLHYPKADDPYGGKKDKKTIQVQVIKKIKNTGEKYEGFQDAVGSWDKYGSTDYSNDFDYGDLVDMYTGDSK
tara:strand:+ start:9657 stop:10502 length:846 start_codon:yes stop_codon:yes gene_type:complete